MTRRINWEVVERARVIAEQEQPEVVRANREAAQPLVDELAAAGFEIRELGDLPLQYSQRRKEYKRIVPILIRWLDRVQNADVRLAIVMALGVPEARPLAALPLIEAFKKEDCDDRFGFHVKSVIASALSIVADDTVFDELVRLIKDRRHGPCRQNLVWALANVKHSTVAHVLTDILDSGEPLIAPQALRPLGRLRVKEARERIAGFLAHQDPWVRKEAKRALEKIDKASG